MKFFQIQGNTWYFAGEDAFVPFYRLSGQSIILLDGGCYGRDAEGILEVLQATHMHVEAVIVTHAHVDHMGLCQQLQKEGAVICMPPFDAAAITSPHHLKDWYQEFPLSELEKIFPFMFLKADVLLDEKRNEIAAGGHKFEIIHTPGHTASHICIRTPDNVLYLGDALMGREECAAAKLPYASDIMKHLESLRRLAGLKADYYIVAHKEVTDSIYDLVEQNAETFQKISEKILALITRPMTLSDILAAVVRTFGFRLASSSYGLRLLERNLRLFLDYLIDLGEIELRAWEYRIVYERI